MKNYLLVVAFGFLALTTASFAQEREWALDASEEDVYLLFGVPNTTDVGVSFWCKISSGTLSMFAPAPSSQKPITTVLLEIGSKSYQLPASVSEGDRQGSIEAKLEPQEKIIAELQTSERFALRLGDHKTIFPLNGADFPGLIKFCNIKPDVTNN